MQAKPIIPAEASRIFPASNTQPNPGIRDWARDHLGKEEWEALVGGSLLNKIGALVLVIGIALFLGYSLTHMGNAVRALTCVAVSWFLLGSGVLLERKRTYKSFARGLIGAGWAALYVTAYAIYALPAAKLIDDPFIGSVLLLVVAIEMTGHSLLYRRQAVTAVAYFAAFGALSITPSTSFTIAALFPLAASLLYLAARLNWNAMALLGVVATYGSWAAHGIFASPLGYSQVLLFVFWLLFECFDLLREKRHKHGAGSEFVFPLNALVFLSFSYQIWSAKNPASLWMVCAFGPLLFLLSAVARWTVRPGDRKLAVDTGMERMKAGSFEAPAVISAGLAGAAIVLRAIGVWMAAGLALEAELLYLSGVVLNSVVLRTLGRVAFGFSLGRLVFHDITPDEVFPGAVKSIHAWTPVALFHALLFYVNRILRTPNTVFS